jgi:hypothetical protein
MDSLGDRMKANYEGPFRRLHRGMPGDGKRGLMMREGWPLFVLVPVSLLWIALFVHSQLEHRACKRAGGSMVSIDDAEERCLEITIVRQVKP